MLPLRKQSVLLLVLVGMSMLALQSRAQDEQGQRSQAAMQLPDSASLPPAQLPPGTIIVSYQNGQLTIEAQYASLSSVLRAACNQTGTALDLSPGTDERVVGVFGPGSVRDVFALLLNGSPFNYVMLGLTEDAARIVRLTLSVKSLGSQETGSVRPAPQSVHPASQAVAKVAEAPTIPHFAQQADRPTAEPNAPDHSALKELRRRHRR
jgi:hypothetical protein